MIEKCLRCDRKNLEVEPVNYMPVIKGVRTLVISDAIVCGDCNTSVMDSAQMDEFRSKVKEKKK